ncbi:MAG TPA: type II CRISPR-associated endonuclease Cas1 [Terriglobia bacterium]|nr:type II CRISPR-associated endonuclease Cas1 [Terriglobia bacterium]
MTDRILDFSDQPANLSVRNGLLVIRTVAQGSPFNPAALQPLEKSDPAPQEQTVPLEDIAVVVAAHPQVSFTLAVVAGLARAGALFVACDDKRQPAAMMLPLITHHLQTERYAAQARLGLPPRKRLWQQIVRAKIAAQARVLEERAGKDHGLRAMSERVRSGDPGNAEARAARIYWPALLGENFRRIQEGDGVNPLLNYGYAVLRAIVARAICAAGLHPTFGLHHCNRYDAFCLADDLMEPFRPLVDHTVARLAAERGDALALDRDTKRALLEPLLGRYISQEESRTLFDWVARTAFSLAAVVDGSASKLEIPVIWYA